MRTTQKRMESTSNVSELRPRKSPPPFRDLPRCRRACPRAAGARNSAHRAGSCSSGLLSEASDGATGEGFTRNEEGRHGAKELTTGLRRMVLARRRRMWKVRTRRRGRREIWRAEAGQRTLGGGEDHNDRSGWREGRSREEKKEDGEVIIAPMKRMSEERGDAGEEDTIYEVELGDDRWREAVVDTSTAQCAVRSAQRPSFVTPRHWHLFLVAA